jgi:hypothetical protein
VGAKSKGANHMIFYVFRLRGATLNTNDWIILQQVLKHEAEIVGYSFFRYNGNR